MITLGELPVLPWSDAAGLPGDYNDDGSVDAADYTLWRDSFGQTGTGLAADGNGDGTIDEGDFEVWRLYYGETTGTGAGGFTGAGVPEPTSGWLLIFGCGLHLLRRGGR